jgi:hypothetical protein
MQKIENFVVLFALLDGVMRNLWQWSKSPYSCRPDSRKEGERESCIHDSL